ncbi:MAG: NAD(P)/FAD-dependent oxidoreductase [Aquabacterium sp.]|nr:MAG: NAD(P)/FAD-dependent oxidoreductase [Aquabacterium sp.]
MYRSPDLRLATSHPSPQPPQDSLPGRTEVVIVGSGFGGLCMAIKLQQAGLRDFVILEKAQEVGGTWRDNHYPGAACDVQSHLYSFSFDTKSDWSKRYAPWREIQDYILDVTKRHGLRRHIRFGREVTGANFDESTGLWTIRTQTGETVLTRHWVLASGPLHVPAIPDIPGLKDFKGKVMHSAQWDHGYQMAGRRVASIGTGGSAIQYVPEIAPQVDKLHVFQRTAAWVIPRDERRYGPIRKALFKLPPLRTLHRWRLYWTNESRVWPIFNPALARVGEAALKRFIAWQVKDQALREKLTPDYTLGCKRVLISNKWFPTFNRPNVELVTEGIREIRENSIVTRDGRERPVDCIVLGTGFVVDPRIYMKDFELTGRNGHVLAEDWKTSPTAYLGICASGYPNMFQLVGPHTGLGHNSIIFMIEQQADYIVRCMQLLKARGAQYLDVKPQAQQDFLAEMTRSLKGTVWDTGCRSWYQTADGINFAIWPKSTWKYWMACLRVKQEHFDWVRCDANTAAAHRRRETAKA